MLMLMADLASGIPQNNILSPSSSAVEGGGTSMGFDNATQSDKIKPLLGYMTQHFSLYRDLTVRENLQFVCKLYGIKDVAGRVTELVKQFAFDNEGRDHQRVGTMSGGWKQRLALACAMAHRPRILLLDEPTAGVDPKAREAFWDILQDIASTGVSVLVSTHYMDEAMRSNRIAYVLYGRLLVDDAPERVLADAPLVAAQVPLQEVFRHPHLAHDPRIVGLALLNPWVRSEVSLARARVKHYYWQRLGEPDFWRKLLRGGVGWGALRKLGQNIQSARDRGSAPTGFQDRMARGWLAFGKPILLLRSERDLTAQEFVEHANAGARWQDWATKSELSNVSIEQADHTCSTPSSRQAVEQETLTWLSKV